MKTRIHRITQIIILCVLEVGAKSFGANTSPSTNDLWDISQGIKIITNSPMRAGFNVADMFGATLGYAEKGSTIFSDGMPTGFVHFVEWRTATPVKIRSLRLFAGGDGPQFKNQREFADFALKAKSKGSTEFNSVLFTFTPSHPYQLLDADSALLMDTNITESVFQEFRAEFIQYNAGRGYDGPRIVELDGFGEAMPIHEPPPINDGIPSSWRESYFGADYLSDPRVAAIADPDEDGANNFQEFLDGTNPLDAESVKRVPLLVSTYAGSEPGGDDGFRTEATFFSPIALKKDSRGRIWVLEGSIAPWSTALEGGHRIRVINTNGMVSTIAGSNEPGYADGPGASARFRVPSDLAFDSLGNVYVSDRLNHRIRKIDSTGVVTTFAGSTAGYKNGQGTNAMFNHPIGLTIDFNNNLFVADWYNRRIRRISPDGEVTTFAGGVPGDRDGHVSIATFDSPACLTIAPDNSIYVADWWNGSIRKISTDSIVSTVASGMRHMNWISLGAKSEIYCSWDDTRSHIWKYSPEGELLWSFDAGLGFEDGEASAAKFGNWVRGALELEHSKVLAADVHNNRLRLIEVGIPPLLTVEPAGGEFTNSVNVTLATIATNGVIHYTLDNSNPTTNSLQCTGGIELTNTTTLKAQVFVNSYPVSQVLSAQYVRKQVVKPGFATRKLPTSYVPGAKLEVALEIAPPSGIAVYAVEDEPPAGWIVGLISHGGAFDTVNKKVKFGPFFDAVPRTLTYETTPPETERGIKHFSGKASADGSEVEIAGDTELREALFHPSDNDPPDYRIIIREMTAYSAAWKRGVVWSEPPNPIPISYVTRAALLWKVGEVYLYDESAGDAPLCWAPAAQVQSHSIVESPAAAKVAKTAEPTAETSAVAAMPAVYLPGQPLTVAINVQPVNGTIAYAVEDQPPADWTVSDISHSGAYDEINHKVKWGPFFDSEPRSLSYQVTPLEQANADVAFNGVISADGVDTAISGQRNASLGSVQPPTLNAAGAGLTAAGFEFGIEGNPGEVYLIEFSEDLLNWTSMDTVTNETGTVTFTDPEAVNRPKSFYRAKILSK